MSKFYIVTSSGFREIAGTVSSGVNFSLSGEMTLDFTVGAEVSAGLSESSRVYYDGLYYNVTGLRRTLSEGICLTEVSCEHESISLADDAVEDFSYTGTPSGALAAILSGTGLTSGGVFSSENVVLEYAGETNRRRLLTDLAARCGGELAFSAHTVSVVSHRGSTAVRVISRYADLSEVRDAREGTVSYELTIEHADISLGDEVRLFSPALGIDAQKRVVTLSFDPYRPSMMSVTLGDYIPEITDTLEEERRETEEKLAETVKKSELAASVRASVDTYINSEEGRASVIISLSGTYAAASDLDGYVSKTSLSAEIGAYIDTKAGTAKIVNVLSGTYITKNDLTGYVTKTTLETEIGSYIDTAAGKAKIVSACSGTYVKGSDLTGYAKSTAVASVEQSVSNVESQITMNASYSNNTIGTNVYALLQLVANPNSSSIKIKADKIEFDGTVYMKTSDFVASGTTMIKGSKIQTADLYIQNLCTSSGKYIIDYSGAKLSLGGTSSSTSSWATFTYIDIMASSEIRFGYSGYAVALIRSTGDEWTLRPYTTSGVFDIGTYSYPVRNLYCTNLYVGGTKISSGSSGGSTSTDRIYAGTSTTVYIQLNSSKVLLPSSTGFEIGSTTYPVKTLYVGTGASYYWKLTAESILPSGTSSLYFAIGSSSYPVQKLYAKEIYLDGTKISAGSSGSTSSDFSNKTVKLGGTTSYYIEATSSKQLKPSTSLSNQPFYLGTSSYYWHYAYIGSDTASIGSKSTSKLGFFGKTPTTQQTVAASATVATLITALKAYGLIA